MAAPRRSSGRPDLAVDLRRRVQEVRQRLGPALLAHELVADEEMAADQLDVAIEANRRLEARVVGRLGALAALVPLPAFAALAARFCLGGEHDGGAMTVPGGGVAAGRRDTVAGNRQRPLLVGRHLRGDEDGGAKPDPDLAALHAVSSRR